MRGKQCIRLFYNRSRTDVDMTQGTIFSHLLRFAVPLLLGNLFQQLYNVADAWVVGNHVSNSAFSAVGSVTPVINLLIGFFMGLSNGTGVVIAQHYGARRYDLVREAVHTAFAMTLLLSVIFTAVGIWMIPAMLRLMKTPAAVWPHCQEYLTIYFAGVTGLLLYNMGASTLQAVGNSRYPFLCLAACTLTNIALDLLLVIRYGMGIRGVAYATVIAQLVSAALVVWKLLRTDSCVKLELRCLAFRGEQLRRILQIGLPAALQMAITAFSNVFIQSYINVFGEDCMSGWTAYSKVDHLILLPITSLGLATTTFVGQNLGKRQTERARKGMHTALWMAEASTVITAAAVCAAAPALVAFFNDKAEVVRIGSMFLRWLTPFYVFGAVNHVVAGALRGAGDSRTPLAIFMIAYVGARQLYFYIVAHWISNTVLPVSMGYPFGWITCAALLLICQRVKGPWAPSGEREPEALRQPAPNSCKSIAESGKTAMKGTENHET